MPINLLRTIRHVSRFFQWGWNLSDRLAFAEVLASNTPLDAPMQEVYQVFGINPEETITLEAYLQDYFSRILRKLKELNYDAPQKQSRKLQKLG
jgi:hypothetical protein